MSRFDSIYVKKKHHQQDLVMVQESEPIRMNFVYHAPAKPPIYYFYRGLKIVLVMWMLLLGAVIVTPWADYYVKLRLKSQQVLGTQTPTTTNATATGQIISNFYIKKGDLEIKAPIVEGITTEALSKGIGHHPDSAWPDQKGNVVIAGHSFSLDPDNPYGQVFANLRDLEINDQVSITYRNKKYTYKISKKETVSPSDMSLMGKSDNWQLTFYTCDPPKTDWRRLVFQAELIKIE